jgi:signal transduction histidine kinase
MKPTLDTLLIVDDMLDNVEVLHDFLKGKGFRILVACSGEDAIETAEYALPNLILLDVMMPDIDGFTVCQRLKLQPSTQEIPIIFMTALADTVDKVKGFSLGAADYITKPFQIEEVLARVNAHLSLHRLRQQLEERNHHLQQTQNELTTRNQQLQREIEIRKKTEASLQQANNTLAERTSELEQRNLELDAFAHTVAHDLKNPLNAIIGATDLLMQDSGELTQARPDKINKLQWINMAGRQAISIIDALLLLAGVSRYSKLQVETLNMADIVEEVIQQRLATELQERQGQIRLPTEWPPVSGYRPWIVEVWVNYLSNGLKYGGQPPLLELGATVEPNDKVRYWVRDNGQGLTTEEQAQLFTPFKRLHQQRGEGHGLGLSIVRQIIEKLGGEVGVNSKEGEGSVFYFTLFSPYGKTKSSQTI